MNLGQFQGALQRLTWLWCVCVHVWFREKVTIDIVKQLLCLIINGSFCTIVLSLKQASFSGLLCSIMESSWSKPSLEIVFFPLFTSRGQRIRQVLISSSCVQLYTSQKWCYIAEAVLSWKCLSVLYDPEKIVPSQCCQKMCARGLLSLKKKKKVPIPQYMLSDVIIAALPKNLPFRYKFPQI